MLTHLPFQGKWREENEKQKKGEEMSLSLYECLKAIGLQRHYARFTSVGICRAAHLSALTMEDYPILGICCMEDRTRLFNLVQMVKALDLEYENSEDYGADSGDEGYTAADSSFSYVGGEDEEDVYNDENERGAAESKLNSTRFTKPSSVRRRLDFNCETIDHNLNLFVYPDASVYVMNSEAGQGKGSALSVQLDSGSAAVCGCKWKNNHRLDYHRYQSGRHTGANTEPKIMEGKSMLNFHTRLSPKCESSIKPKPQPETVASKLFNNKLFGHKDRKGLLRKKKPLTEISSNAASEHTPKPTPVYELMRTAGYNYGLPLSSPPAPNKTRPGAQRISVCVRKRPLTRTECRRGETDVLTTPSEECVIVHESKEAVDLTQYILKLRFYFDQVFGEESSNEEVYQRTAYPLVQHMLNGGKATCFAYGQTGAGKTHTMLGSPVRPGLYALAVRDIFAHLSTTHMNSPLLVYVSFFEIYCGQLYDLLDHRKRLFAREDGLKVVHIVGLRDVRVNSVSSLMEVISQGTEVRTQGVSGVNPLSSRSHALLQIQLRDANQQIAGRMWFVDLAGSERASDTKEDRQSRMEGAEINQSLLALKECIRSLDQEQSHTPFRQSKLTQVLKDSFVGDSMTCMIANISPGHLATENTLNTLRYADRVKELKGLRGGRREKTNHSPKRNLSNSSSSSSKSTSSIIGTRGKSPPKKPKLGRHREDFCPISPTIRLTMGGENLCSTPKNSRWGEETTATTRKGIDFEHITPVGGLLGMSGRRDRMDRADRREGRKRERYGVSDSVDNTVGDQNIEAELVLRQSTDERLHLWEVPRESGLCYRGKERQRSSKGAGKDENRGMEQRRKVGISRDTCDEAERLREKYLKKADEREKDRESHLRQYHQQLQQFMPSSSSVLFSSSTSPSISSSNQASLSSSVSPSTFQQSSSLSVSALMCHGLEGVFDTYGANVKVRVDSNRGQSSFFPSQEICLQTKTSPSCNTNKAVVSPGDSGGSGDAWRVSRDGKEERFGQDRDTHEKLRSLKAAGEGEVRVRREEWRPAMEGKGVGRWTWVASTETEQAHKMTGAIPDEAVVLYNRHTEEGEEGLNVSDVTADRVCSTEERRGADSYGCLSSQRNIDSSSLFNRPLDESSRQRAIAEQPLSPACGQPNTPLTPNPSFELKHTTCTSNIEPIPLENAHQEVPLSSCRVKPPWFNAHDNIPDFSNSQWATLPLTTPTTQNRGKIPAEPLNISSENPAYTMAHNGPDADAKKSELPQEETAGSISFVMDPLSISLLQVDQQADNLSFLQWDQNRTTASPPKTSTRSSMQTSVMQSNSSSVNQSANTGSLSTHDLTTNGPNQKPSEHAHNMHKELSLAISTPQSERVLGQLTTVPKHCQTVHSNTSIQTNSPLQLNNQESTSNQQIRPICLSRLEDLDHGQWRVVQAHWEQLEEMEALCRKEGMLLCRQPDMAFGDYIHKLKEIMERKALCVHIMKSHLQQYLKPSQCNQPHHQEKE
ncbi:uncharacterized protein LOC117543954 [Gymnodraco acuticeps]|uniref:Uncharacterized protein LOC117543954 n=1 Tax=Gymnodraco acuticeps TaxID=8218 RepID=A0A6P8USD0_GYMAC|nr:uncharacterized protein LOC117543954 [Gymnodraco acuticeps]